MKKYLIRTKYFWLSVSFVSHTMHSVPDDIVVQLETQIQMPYTKESDICNKKDSSGSLLAMPHGNQACSMQDDKFVQLWSQMQDQYKKVSDVCDNMDPDYRNQFLHPWWIKTTNEVATFIRNEPCRNFLDFKPIAHNMVVKGIDLSQKYNVCFLHNLANDGIHNLIKSYKDSDFFLLPTDCNDYKCSSNALRYLYYAAKSLDKCKNIQQIKTIVEFGSGYGGMAYVFDQLMPESTLILIDLPEFLAIQYLALSAVSQKKILLHTQVPSSFEEGAIHLIPVFLIPEISITADFFVSTYALSESPEFVQKNVISKDFFKASLCYITGQLNGWGSNNFPHHRTIIDALRGKYPNLELNPFYLYLEDLESYEAIAYR